MNADGQICTQRAIDKAGKEFATGLEYMRSSPLASLNYYRSFGDPPSWFLPSRVNSGHLDFTPEDGVIKRNNLGSLEQRIVDASCWARGGARYFLLLTATVILSGILFVIEVAKDGHIFIAAVTAGFAIGEQIVQLGLLVAVSDVY